MKSLLIKLTLLTILLGIGNSPLFSQNHYWVYLSDKNQSQFAANKYFDTKAIERRLHHHIPVSDSFDYPVSQYYEEVLSFLAEEFIGSSRWLNASLVLASQEQSIEILSLPFVKKVAPLHGSESISSSLAKVDEAELENIRRYQVGTLGSRTLRRLQASGKGIRIAVLDGGFPGVDKHPGFEHIIARNKIKATWNFPRNSENVYRDNDHGTSVLSCISGFMNERATGLASDAEFLLARTELEREPWKEQLYWIQAAEWADKNGAQIIASSLGYTAEHYFPEDMDGSSPVAEAARIAFQKGILVINSIGNDGDKPWKVVGTPADAGEVLTVGSLDMTTGIKSNFSSFGPSLDGTIKPNVVAAGRVVAANTKSWAISYGTSFSAPLIAGYAACLWQLYPELSNKELFKLIEKTGNLYPYFDYAHGFGLPNASRIGSLGTRNSSDILTIETSADSIFIKIDNSSRLRSELLYFHFVDSNNKILEYQVIDLSGSRNFAIKNDFLEAILLRVRLGNQVEELKLKND